MFIRQISIRRFRHLEDLSLGPFAEPPPQSDIVVLAGPNGGGKSSVLELLGYALSSSWSLGWSLARTFPEFSFEVSLGLHDEEVRILHQWAQESGSRLAPELEEYLTDSRELYRAFNYEGGAYAENPNLQNQLFNVVTATLREHYQRSLGFFLRSERVYPARTFQREAIFNYPTIRQKSYVWSVAFNTSEVQYQDIFDFLVQQRYHYFAELGSWEYRRNRGDNGIGGRPADPLAPYDQLLGRLFPSYHFADPGEGIPQNLFVSIPNGETIPFGDLSSGEKEVFFVLCFFLRHDVTNAVLVIDEPELHLHPQLARNLIREMMRIRPGNQIWVGTHSSEIIDEAGRDRVIYLTRNPKTFTAELTLGVDEEAAITRLRDLFGFSGYVGVARTLVFLEGSSSSADRKVLTGLFPDLASQLRFVPAGGVENLTRLNAAILSVLEANLGWMRFYSFRDRDYLTDPMIQQYRHHASGRIYVWSRNQIENYLLEDEAISRVLRDIYGRVATPESVAESLMNIARGISGEVATSMLSFRLNLLYRPQDFSLGRLLSGQPLLNADGEVFTERVEALRQRALEKAREVSDGLGTLTREDAIDELVRSCIDEVVRSFDDGQWRSLFPGKVLLDGLARQDSLGPAVALQNNIMKQMGGSPGLIPRELQIAVQIAVDDGSLPGELETLSASGT